LARSNTGNRRKPPTAKDAKYGFGRLIDLALGKRVAVEEFERLKALETQPVAQTRVNERRE
jgi:hypothetical protein